MILVRNWRWCDANHWGFKSILNVNLVKAGGDASSLAAKNPQGLRGKSYLISPSQKAVGSLFPNGTAMYFIHTRMHA